MNKYEAITIIVAIVVIFGALASGDYLKSKRDTSAIEAGLEQCVLDRGVGIKTIWVKDCTKFMKARDE